MHYKIKGAIKKNKDRFIIFIILWIIMAIALVAPIAYAQNRATVDGVFDFGKVYPGFCRNGGEDQKGLWRNSERSVSRQKP